MTTLLPERRGQDQADRVKDQAPKDEDARPAAFHEATGGIEPPAGAWGY